MSAERVSPQSSVLTSFDSAQDRPRSSTVLAFDFGLRRIGVATGDLQLRIAHPLETIPTHAYFDRIRRLVKEWQPALFVVGLPHSEDGEEREITRACRRFGRELETRFGIEVRLFDERFTSSEAAAALKEAGIAGIRQKPLLDKVAAQQILQSFFDAASRR
jgi:putative Holliday junction resolvase